MTLVTPETRPRTTYAHEGTTPWGKGPKNGKRPTESPRSDESNLRKVREKFVKVTTLFPFPPFSAPVSLTHQPHTHLARRSGYHHGQQVDREDNPGELLRHQGSCGAYAVAVFERFSVRFQSSPSFLSRRVARLIRLSSNPSLTPNSPHVPISTQFTCSPIAPNSVLYPWTIIVNECGCFPSSGSSGGTAIRP